jgi:hypothetical protein
MPEFLVREEGSEDSLKLGTKSPWFWKKDYDSFGLSPNCKLAFVLRKRNLDIYFLNAPPNLRAEPRDSFKGKFEHAVLSNRYLVAFERYELRAFELSARDHRLVNKKSTPLESQSKKSRWIPKCLAIFDDGRCAWIAVGFRVKKGPSSGGDIKVYLVSETGIREETGRQDAGLRTSVKTPLESDYVHRIAFSSGGDRLVCVTNNNRVLIWSWSDNAQSWQRPFEIERDFRPVR